MPIQRSFLAAYGPLIAVGIVAALAVLVLVSMRPAPEPTPANTAPLQTPRDYEQKKSVDTRTLMMQTARRTGGDWAKATNEEKVRINGISQGHGKEMLRLYADRIKSGELK